MIFEIASIFVAIVFFGALGWGLLWIVSKVLIASETPTREQVLEENYANNQIKRNAVLVQRVNAIRKLQNNGAPRDLIDCEWAEYNELKQKYEAQNAKERQAYQ